jgi:hypothetical protein
MIKDRRFWIGLIFALLFLGLFFHKADLTQMWQSLTQANYAFILPAILVYFIGVWFRALRWRFLLKPVGSVSSLRLFPIIVIGHMVNNILPARLGIIARAFILGNREGISKMASGTTIVVERVFDGLVLLLFLIIPLLLTPLPDWANTLVRVVTPLLLVALILMMLIASSERLTQRTIGFLERISPKRWRHRISEWAGLFISGLGVLRSPLGLILIFATSIAVWLCEASIFYLVSMSFALGQPFHVLLLATSVANLTWALLMPPGGIGPFDYFCQQILIFFNVSAPLATAYSGTLHAAILLPAIILGFVFLGAAGLSLREVTRGKTEPSLNSPQSDEVYHEEGKG